MINDLDYMVLNLDMGCFMMKSECEQLGCNYEDFVGSLLEDCDDEEELMEILYGENWQEQIFED